MVMQFNRQEQAADIAQEKAKQVAAKQMMEQKQKGEETERAATLQGGGSLLGGIIGALVAGIPSGGAGAPAGFAIGSAIGGAAGGIAGEAMKEDPSVAGLAQGGQQLAKGVMSATQTASASKPDSKGIMDTGLGKMTGQQNIKTFK